MINIQLNEDTKCTVIRNGEAEVVKHPAGTNFEDVVEINYADGHSEWQHLDEDMVATFIPQNKAVVLS
jgi:hypothetical protein